MTLPPRTADTMSEAIAISSPSGRMSKRARAAADKRLHDALFGTEPYDLRGTAAVEPQRDRLLRQAATLRGLAARGMSARKFTREAERLEALAAAETA
jgi:hypothetical protein